jgi:hypothetical protein
MVLFADDTSIIVTDTNQLNFKRNLNQTFQDINTWFNANLLTLNYNKTQYVEFRPMNYYNVTTQISHDQTKLTNVTESKCLGLIIDSILSWKQHIEYVIKKISTACYACYTLYHKLWHNHLGWLFMC